MPAPALDRSCDLFSAYLWPGQLLLAAPALHNDLHRHVGASVLIGLEQPFRLGVASEVVETRLALLGPELRHWLQADAPIVVLRLDPDQPLYRRELRPALEGQTWRCPPLDTLADTLPALSSLAAQPPSCEDAARLCLRVLIALRGPRAEGPPLDPRVAELVARLRSALPDAVSSSALATRVGLSTSRLTHLFKQETGVTMRRFVLALRLQEAVKRWRADRTLTHLAHELGFADLAHLSQAGRAYIGIAPSTLIGLFGSGLADRVFICSGCNDSRR